MLQKLKDAKIACGVRFGRVILEVCPDCLDSIERQRKLKPELKEPYRVASCEFCGKPWYHPANLNQYSKEKIGLLMPYPFAYYDEARNEPFWYEFSEEKGVKIRYYF